MTVIQILPQFQFGVSFTFITETVFGTSTGQLVALLFATIICLTDARTGITVKIDRHRGGGSQYRTNGQSQR